VSDGFVTGVAAGVATLEASVGGVTGSASVTITTSEPAPAVVTLFPATPTVIMGDSTQLTAVARDASGQPLKGLGFRWTSSDATVASVSERGVAAGRAVGRVRITATTDNGASGAVVVAVARPAAAALQVILPNWANVSVDGKSYGQRTRFQLPIASGTPYALRFERPGYVTVDTAVTVPPGDTLVLRIQMNPTAPVASGVLQMRIQPWASVTIDGKALGERPIRSDTLTAGVPHRLHFERDGYMTFDTTVILRPGETRGLQVNMKRRSP
jgi:hypothetical protein